MRPQTQNFDGLLFFIDLIYQPMLNIDSAAICAVQITDQLFMRRRHLTGVVPDDLDQRFRLIRQMRTFQFWHILRRCFGIDDFIHISYQSISSSLRQSSSGSFMPFISFSRIPEADTRYNVSIIPL